MMQDVTVTVTFTLRPPVSGTLIMRFLEGVNLATGQTERDETLLAFGAGAMTHTQNILLPNVPNLFDFGTSVTLHFEYRQAQMVLVPENAVADMSLLDTLTGGKAYADIADGDVTSLLFQSSAPQAMSPSKTVILRRTDGRIYKLGQCALASDQWGVTCAYQELRP